MATVQPSEKVKKLSLASQSVHADDGISGHRAVAPALHVSTTYEYAKDPAQLVPHQNEDAKANAKPNAPADSHIYSRDSNPNTTRLESVLSAILGQPTLVYASGLAAFHGLIVHLAPKRVAIGGGYHGVHGVLSLLTRLTGLEVVSLDEIEKLGSGDVVHVETPLNPTGEARDLAKYAKLAHERGAFLTVDATFAPPPLLDPFAWGADAVMHSGTKYLGGHSDMLCGTLSTRHADWVPQLAEDRMILGAVMGSLEGWLGLRSVRTLELRVRRQSASAQALVDWLEAERQKGGAVAKVVEKVVHASLQPEAKEEGSWLRRQMPNGFGPVFAVVMKDEEKARDLPSKLDLFHHATSLGGVESLIEWRAMSDDAVDRRLLRVSVGVEDPEDLKADLLAAFEELAK